MCDHTSHTNISGYDYESVFEVLNVNVCVCAWGRDLSSLRRLNKSASERFIMGHSLGVYFCGPYGKTLLGGLFHSSWGPLVGLVWCRACRRGGSWEAETPSLPPWL